MDIYNHSILAFHTSIYLTNHWRLWTFLNSVKDSIILNYGQPWLNNGHDCEFQISDVHNCSMHTYNWNVDVHNSVMDTIILNYGQLFIGKHAYPQLFAFGIPSIHIPDWKKKKIMDVLTSIMNIVMGRWMYVKSQVSIIKWRTSILMVIHYMT